MATYRGLGDRPDVVALVSHPDVLAQVASAGTYTCELGSLDVSLYRPTDVSDVLTVTVWDSNDCIVCWDVVSLAALASIA